MDLKHQGSKSVPWEIPVYGNCIQWRNGLENAMPLKKYAQSTS